MQTSLAGRPFWRMNGAGNKILVLDLTADQPQLEADLLRRLAARSDLQFDQLMAIEPAQTYDSSAHIRIYNKDGSTAMACGNGMRCVAWVLAQQLGRDDFHVTTPAGTLSCSRQGDWRFRVEMPHPRFGWQDIPLAWSCDTSAVQLSLADAPALPPAIMVNMGNPHAVFFFDTELTLDIRKFGPQLERHEIFPDRANISFARVRDRRHIDLDVWERGAGITLACGSASCATAVAAIRSGRSERKVEIKLPGGVLEIHWPNDEAPVEMTGPVELELSGVIEPEWLLDAVH